MQESTYAILSLGFGLGLLHALDADHVMAVSSLASREDSRPRRVRTVLFCAKWAIGHGGVLMMLGTCVIVLGAQIPAGLSYIAEKMVGVILIALGAWIFWQFFQHRIRVGLHSHDNLTHSHLEDGKHEQHDHSPVLIGITHGLAGSAPILALIPALNISSKWVGLSYIALFSVGVVTTMLVFGLGYGHVQQWLEKRNNQLFDLSRLLMASLAMAFGVYWLIG